ncbi:MAG TPA: hypothetical protein VLJ41_17170 [Segetibacter sp.]|nr:hypothetical protein [Segetibacter sp.]
MFNVQFTYEEIEKWYSITVEDVKYMMPFVMTLKFKRFVGNKEKIELKNQIEEWFSSLPTNEKSLVKKVRSL